VVGLGPAAIRDLIAFLKHDSAVGGRVLLGDQRRFLKRFIGYGVSQSGRFLRTFLYQGFNCDEQDRQVFDGMFIHVAGGGRGSFNHRFAQPSRDGNPYSNTLYPTDIFPFTDNEYPDPETGRPDGLLARARRENAVPKIFYTNGSYEYWGRSAGLSHITPDGKEDAAIPDTSRVYYLTGTEHGAGTFPPARTGTRHLRNVNDYRPILRGLLTALNGWVAEGKPPPPSRYPRIADGTLVPLERLRFPKISGVVVPQRPQRAYQVDYGAGFRHSGVVSKEPPAVGKPFPLLVPQVDSDGNEQAGIRAPEVQVPLGTYTGWNLRDASIGAGDEMYSLNGGFFPLAQTREERARRGDPRPAIAERYPSPDEHRRRVEKAALELVQAGYVLERDVPFYVERAGRQWAQFAGSR
jgi:hypothetical protein